MSHPVVPLAERIAGIPLLTRIQELDSLGRELEAAGEHIIYLTNGEPDFDTPDSIRAAAVLALTESHTHYVSNRGIPELREAIAAKLAVENGIRADPSSEILVTNGGAQALFLALMATLNPGDEIIVQDPSYGPYATTARLLGLVPVFARSSSAADLRFRPDLGAMERAVTPRTRAIIVNSPCNPTGVVLTKAELEALGAFACSHNLLIIADEVYERIVYANHKHLSMASIEDEFSERTITINSFSKTYAMTGWRVGYLVGPAHVIDVAAMIQQNSGRMATSFVQWAAIVALCGPQDSVDRMVEEYDERRGLVMEAVNGMAGLSCTPPEGAFYAFVRVANLGYEGLEFAMHLLAQGNVAVTPGDFFGPAGRDYVRISFAQNRSSLIEAMAAMKSAVASLGAIR